MTPMELERLVNARDPERLVAAMSPLSEAERKALAKAAARLYRERDRFVVSPDNSCEGLAVLGLCSWSDARRTEIFAWGRSRELPYRVLKARRPEWLDRWVEKELSDGSFHWHLIRRLVRAGLCPKPMTDNYTMRMVQARAGLERFDGSLADHLRKHSEILMDLWRIFEIDFGREAVLMGDTDGHPCSWQSAMVSLASTGELDRARMLTATLTARQSRSENASFFCKLHDALNPMLEERAERQEFYRALLASPHPHVIGFALGAFKVIAEAGRLEVAPFLEAVGPALELRQKGHAIAAAQVLELAAKQAPEHLGAIAGVAARGLGHTSPDVQKRCVKLIEMAAAGGPNETLAAEIASRLALVAASVKPHVDSALGQLRAEVPVAERDRIREAGPEVSAAEIDSIPSHWRKLADMDEALHVLRNGGELPVLQFDAMSVPRLDPAAALTPIASFDELVDRASAAVEELTDADELELLLDGISRLAGHMRVDFTVRTAPLLHRLQSPTSLEQFGGRSLDPDVRFRLLVRSWLEGQPIPTMPGDVTAQSYEGFLTLRMAVLSRRLLRNVGGPLLACPTHRGGWIDPRELVARLRYWQEHDAGGDDLAHVPGISDRYDFIQALLRLAPDFRKEALQSAHGLRGESGAATRFALGGDEPIGRSAGLWIAAARAREPRGTFPKLAEVHGDLGPDAAVPVTYEWGPADPNPDENWRAYPGPSLRIAARPFVRPEHLSLDRPLAWLNRLHGPRYVGSILDLRCRATVWPADPDASFAAGAMDIVERMNQSASTFSPTAQVLDPLFDPDTPFTEMAALALAVGLLSKDPGTRGLAVDAMIALIEDGRCTGKELGPIYGRLASKKEMVRLNRLVAALTEVARVSELHEWVVVRTLAGTLAALQPPLPADLHHLLSALHEGLIKTGQTLGPEARAVLASITTSGKTAAVAKSLLALQPAGGPGRHQSAAIHLALAGRIKRAKRWAALDARAMQGEEFV